LFALPHPAESHGAKSQQRLSGFHLDLITPLPKNNIKPFRDTWLPGALAAAKPGSSVFLTASMTGAPQKR
jgi:hypothetical protein